MFVLQFSISFISNSSCSFKIQTHWIWNRARTLLKLKFKICFYVIIIGWASLDTLDTLLPIGIAKKIFVSVFMCKCVTAVAIKRIWIDFSEIVYSLHVFSSAKFQSSSLKGKIYCLNRLKMVAKNLMNNMCRTTLFFKISHSNYRKLAKNFIL